MTPESIKQSKTVKWARNLNHTCKPVTDKSIHYSKKAIPQNHFARFVGLLKYNKISTHTLYFKPFSSSLLPLPNQIL